MNNNEHLDILSLENAIDSDAEFIPLMTQEEEEELMKEETPEILPILTLRNSVLFPGVVNPITAGRDQSIALLKDAYENDKIIGVVAQKDGAVENPKPNQFYKIGTVAKIIKMLKMPDGNTTVIIQGKRRFIIEEITQEEPYYKAKVKTLDEEKPLTKQDEFKALVESIKELATEIIKINPNIPSEASFALANIESPSFLVNFIASNLNVKSTFKQKILEQSNIYDRAIKLLKYLNDEKLLLQLKNNIQNKVKSGLDQQQREYFLNQQIKTIQDELGENTNQKELDEMLKKSSKKKWSSKIQQFFTKEVQKLQRMNSQMPEYNIQRNYLEFMLDLPWNKFSKDKFDIEHAEKTLDKDHFGLEKVKERIIEHLAVLKLKGDMKSPIICLYGPPGVGKTSLGRSIANALGRKYVRMSLGGVHDESELRGHRKTYIGAMPGRILKSLKKVKTNNPVFILDEIDKLGRGNHGDPSSAMLEILDPEQNTSFHDNYLEKDYDLSKVMFIATANSLSSIQPALRDRMEIIHVSGYTIEEKVEIAKRHLLQKQIKENGLKKNDVKINDELWSFIIGGYTRESGVRGLEKTIAKLIRYAAKNKSMNKKYQKNYTKELVIDILGAARLDINSYEGNDVAGVVTGLAWTQVGGDILYIESILTKGKGNLSITGNLGKVMKESATIALQYLKSHAEDFNIKPSVFDDYNIHIHVPEGATPKDGPSAGVTMLTSMMSSFTQYKVRKNLAMTGEITLRGRVLPVGGIKEKILAAKRAHIKEIILCHENKKDIDEIEKSYLKGLKFKFVKTMKEVLDYAILKEKVKHSKKL